MAVSIWNNTLLNISPRMMNVPLIGVAKNRFNTKVVLKLKNINAMPKTAEANNENPNCPGRIKSMVLYLRMTLISWKNQNQNQHMPAFRDILYYLFY